MRSYEAELALDVEDGVISQEAFDQILASGLIARLAEMDSLGAWQWQDMVEVLQLEALQRQPVQGHVATTTDEKWQEVVQLQHEITRSPVVES